MNIADKLLQVKEVHKTFGEGQGETVALKGVSFDVLPGEFLGIMGASGSGKTTLLNTIATMLKPTAGQILLEGKNISSFKGAQLASYRGRKIGYLYQEFELIDNLTARENIILPLSIHGVNPKEQEEQLQSLMKQFDIENILHKFPAQLSGGQKQRVAAARALISNPSIVLADEPTGALDTKNAKILMDKLYANNQEEGSTILMVTHDANAASYCSRILFIQDGMIFHELRKKVPGETQNAFYERILTVLAQLGGGSSNVL
ncbi:ABC transporter ATP-binding protein [Psychrobacillus sp. NPDC093180]|uniref:ABC transporter ATP-binding protein n=1 Tax=Psychrobacillus sp. NPDC093180 TaxID=3364489 RepID=UPI00380B8BB9